MIQAPGPSKVLQANGCDSFAWIEDLRLRREGACMSPSHALAVHLVLLGAQAVCCPFLQEESSAWHSAP